MENYTAESLPTSSNVTEFPNSNATIASEISGGNTQDYTEVARMIQVVGRPILIICGTFGNLLTFYIMRRGSLKKVSTCFYMAILALADTGVLWSGAFISWIGHLTRWTVNADTWTDCKFNWFIYFFFRQYSSALLVTMSIEKFFALYFPFKTKSVCTVYIAKRLSLATAIFFALFNSQYLFLVDAKKDSNGYGYCVFVHVPKMYPTIQYRIDSTLYSFAPFTIMTVANLAIIYKFILTRTKDGENMTSQALTKSARKGTAMLISVSITFVILTGPLAIVYSITSNPHPLVNASIYILQYLNHSINGLLYCIVGPKFRSEFVRTFEKCGWCGRNKVGNVIQVSVLPTGATDM